MDRSLKIASSIMLIWLLIFSILPMKTEAFTDFDTMKSQADTFINKGKSGNVVNENEIAKIIAPIARFLVGVGAIVVVIVTILMGFKYMTAADPNTQAQIKKQMLGLVISAVVIFGAYGIWTFVYNFMENITQ